MKAKGSAASQPAGVMPGRPPQSAPRGVPPSQPRPDEFSQRTGQSYQNLAGPMPQSVVVAQGALTGQLQPQGQARLPGQQHFYPGQGRQMRIPRHPPQNPPMYSSPPAGHIVPILPPGGPPFIPPPQNPQFMHQHVDFGQISMAGPPQAQYRPQQPMPSQFPPVSGPSQPQGHFGYPPQTMYPMAPQSSHVFYLRGPPPQLSGMQPFQAPNYQEPRARERKIIQIKDPSSNKDVTQEILAGGHSSGSVTGSTGGTPNTTPDVSGHSSSSSTPPLTLQQQNEANVRAQFAAQVAATLVISSEEKLSPPSAKPEDNSVTIQKVTGKSATDTINLNEATVAQKSEVVTDTNISESNSLVMEVEGSMKSSGELPIGREDFPNDSGNEEEVAVGISTALESADNLKEACSADPSVSEKEVVQASPTELLLKESELSSSSTGDQLMAEKVPVAVQDNEPQSTSEMETVNEPDILNGPVGVSSAEEKEEKGMEEAIENVNEVEVAPPLDIAVQTSMEDVSEKMEQCATEPQTVGEEPEEIEVISTASDSEDAGEIKKLNGHELDSKPGALSKHPANNQPTGKEMKKKRQRNRLKDMEKRYSEKETDMMDAYTERAVKEEVPAEPDEGTAKLTEQKELATEEEAEENQSEDESWEDKEATWSQLEAESQQTEGGKLTYEREFLLQFQYTPVCTLKPAGLPDLEVVLGTARPPPKAGYQPNRIPNTGGGDMFLPGFMRPLTKNNQQNANRGRNRMPPKKIITLNTPPAVDLKRTENRWIRPSELSKTMDEQHQKTEDLYRKVRSILNKLTPQKFQTLTQQIIDLDVDTAERLEGVIDLIFEKAIDEPGFSVAYANMCRCLVPKKVVVEKDGKEVAVTFRKILLNKCQKEFEKEKSDEKKIHEKLEELSDKGLTEEEVEQRKEELHEEERKAKRRTLGNIRFIGELFKLKMLTESIMHDCVVKLIRSNDEESFECLCKLLVTIGKDLDHEKAKPRVDQYFHQINKIIQARITSSRVRFMMQDIVDLRCNSWVPRREDNNPKTIDQIHKEAADEAKKTQIMIQQAKQEKRQRGNMGGRDSPRLPVTAPNDETWTTVGRGPRNISVDPKKFQNIKQRPVDSENISLGPGGRGYGAWARGSSGGTGSVGAGAGPSVAAAATVGGDADSRPSGNRYSALAGERRASAPARQNSSGAGRQEPRSPVVGGGRRGPTVPSEREKALEAVRAVTAVTQPKRNSQEREAGRESPKLPVDAPPSATPSSVAVSSSPIAEPELTEDQMRKKAVADLKEYLHINDLPGAIQCFKNLRSPSTHHVFVSEAFNHTMEKHSKERIAAGKLMHSLLREGLLTSEQYLKGIQEIFEFAEEMEIDIPHVWKYLGEIIGSTAFDGVLPLQSVNQLASRFVTKKLNGAKLFAQILNTAVDLSSPEDVKAVWRRTGLALNVFFESQQDAEDFAKDKNIEFALGQASSSQDTSSAKQHSARIQEELRTLILKRKARNEELFDWIDETAQHPDFKSKPFIRALVTAVCEEILDKETGGSCKCNSEQLKDRKAVLQRCIDHNSELELQALYAVQALCVRLDHPPGFMKTYFDCLYDEEIITEESYFVWESSEDPQEQNGKGLARTATSEFFRWLRSAPEESGEDS